MPSHRYPPLPGRASPSTVVPSFAVSRLWKMDSAPGAGFAIRIHRGRKARSRTPTSASVALCRAIRTCPPSASRNWSPSPTISIHCPGSALVTARPPRSSWPICAIAGNPLPSTRHCCTWIRFSILGTWVREARATTCIGRAAQVSRPVYGRKPPTLPRLNHVNKPHVSINLLDDQVRAI